MNPEKVNNTVPVVDGASSNSETTGLNRSTSERVDAALKKASSKGWDDDKFLISSSRSVSSNALRVSGSTVLDGQLGIIDNGYTSCPSSPKLSLRAMVVMDDPDVLDRVAERDLRRKSESAVHRTSSSSSTSLSQRSESGRSGLREKIKKRKSSVEGSKVTSK